MFQLEPALKLLVAMGGSDLHLAAGCPPTVRVRGELEPVPGAADLTARETESVLASMVDDAVKLAEFENEGEVDFSCEVSDVARVRVNAFRQRGSVALVCRTIPNHVPQLEELGVPDVVGRLADEQRGIVLVTGATGSGKSTTLAAMVDHINRTKARHVVTIEDPIEFVHRNRRSIVNQREVGADTASFRRALRRVLRQDPDVILIGEMRDEETVGAALSAAATGHLVLSSVHTVDAPETINRIAEFFPPHQERQLRAMLAGTLTGIVSQRLLPTADAKDRAVACEVLVSTPRVRDMIIDAEKTPQLRDAIAEGEYYGMTTFDQALLALHRAGTISLDDALRAATDPHDLKLTASTTTADAADPQVLAGARV